LRWRIDYYSPTPLSVQSLSKIAHFLRVSTCPRSDNPEAERERRAKIVAAEGEYQAAVKLGQAADIITEHPVALQLRTLQTMAEISVEKNSTIIFLAQFMTTVQEAVRLLSKDSASK
jgi:hypothetical protein